MNEQTPPTPDEPTAPMPAADEPATRASVPPSRSTLLTGGAVIAVICGLVGYQLGDNRSSEVDQRITGPGPGLGNQQQMMPPGRQGQGQGQGQGSQRQSGPPMSRAS
jgi:hypothetical protein